MFNITVATLISNINPLLGTHSRCQAKKKVYKKCVKANVIIHNCMFVYANNSRNIKIFNKKIHVQFMCSFNDRFSTILVIRQCRIVVRLYTMNWNEFGRNQAWLISRLHPKLCWMKNRFLITRHMHAINRIVTHMSL